MPGTRTLFGVAVVARNEDGLVLVGRRYVEPGAPLAIPGGKPEPGGTIDPAAPPEGLFAATQAPLERLPGR
jgi:hypothetical protein